MVGIPGRESGGAIVAGRMKTLGEKNPAAASAQPRAAARTSAGASQPARLQWLMIAKAAIAIGSSTKAVPMANSQISRFVWVCMIAQRSEARPVPRDPGRGAIWVHLQ
jgi:hypothetical protein